MMRRYWTIGLLVSGVLALAACDDDDAPSELACTEMLLSDGQLTEVGGAVKPSMAETFIRREVEPGAEIDVLLLSSGGQWGAFSAGFLNGWSLNPADPRPEPFQVVTGVSTGALQAPFAFAGRRYDPVLRDLYYGVGEEAVLRRRSSIELLSAPSIWDPTPLEQAVDKYMSEALLVDLAEAAQSRPLLIGATSMSSGFFEAFDLTSMAASGAAEALDCLREGLLASTAIPIAFPPRRIGGSFYIDGATRQGLFLESLAETGLRPTIYVLVNKAVGFPADDPPFELPILVGRAQFIINDTLLRQATIEAMRFARARGWPVRGVVAPDIWPGPECRTPEGNSLAFCPSFTRELYEAGFNIAVREEIPWLDTDALIEVMERDRAAVDGRSR
jgi:predicted acylesterase/phospholipase RssA